MPLSEHEQRMLAEIESALYAEDPKFVSSVRKSSNSGVRPFGLLSVLLALLGIVFLVGGLALDFKPGGFPVLSLVGFLMMFAAGLLLLRRPKKKAAGSESRDDSVGSSAKRRGATSNSGNQKNDFTGRMEDRFRRRFEE